MLATMLAEPLQIPEEEVERWVREFDCWSVCDSACIALLWKTPFAWRKVREWSRREPEYERRAAFALLAGLAVHDKRATDKQFRAALRLVSKAAGDERNFVKKAVNWALRQIGKRNASLREAAIQVAESLIATESRSATMRCANCAARPRHEVQRRRFSSSVRRMIGNTAKSRSPATSSLTAISVSRFRTCTARWCRECQGDRSESSEAILATSPQWRRVKPARRAGG